MFRRTRAIHCTNSRYAVSRCATSRCAISRSTPSALVLAAMLAFPALSSTHFAQPFISVAQAQEDNATHPAVVLDFDVPAGVDASVGRKAADAVAVEMEASTDFNVIPRQQVEDAVATRNGIFPPYTPGTQRRLGETLGARSVMSGRVLSAIIGRNSSDPRIREARVTLQLRQLEVRSGDFVNGTQVTSVTTDPYGDIDDDVLINQSVDKAAYEAVRTIRLITFPEGRVMHVRGGEVEMSLGWTKGLRKGQRFSVLRDTANKTRGPFENVVTVERVKVAELEITSVDDHQARGRIVTGGSVGVRTNDIVRRIFAPGLTFTEPTFERLPFDTTNTK
jgi:hypothetical protein